MGPSGASCSLTLGNITVNTLDSGSNATLSIVKCGTSLDNVWNMSFGLPRGIDGTDGVDGVDGNDGIDGVNGISSTITLGNIITETLPSTSSALVTVTNSGTINDAIFNMKFQIPQGIEGIQGEKRDDEKI